MEYSREQEAATLLLQQKTQAAAPAACAKLVALCCWPCLTGHGLARWASALHLPHCRQRSPHASWLSCIRGPAAAEGPAPDPRPRSQQQAAAARFGCPAHEGRLRRRCC